MVPEASQRIHVRKGRRSAARGLPRLNWPTEGLSHTSWQVRALRHRTGITLDRVRGIAEAVLHPKGDKGA